MQGHHKALLWTSRPSPVCNLWLEGTLKQQYNGPLHPRDAGCVGQTWGLPPSTVTLRQQFWHLHRKTGGLWSHRQLRVGKISRGTDQTSISKSTSPPFSSVAQLCLTLCDPMDCSMPGFPVHHQHPALTQTHVHWVGDAIQPSHSLSSPSPPAFNLSQYQVFSNESVLHIRWPKYWSFSFSISPSNEHSGLISFRIGWFVLRVVQGTLKSLLQHHSSKGHVPQAPSWNLGPLRLRAKLKIRKSAVKSRETKRQVEYLDPACWVRGKRKQLHTQCQSHLGKGGDGGQGQRVLPGMCLLYFSSFSGR